MPSQFQTAKDRRKVKTGFPKEFVFLNPNELNDYLSGHRITCLLCGKDYKALGHHLLKIHEMSSEDYKAKYGIPFTRGLTCESTFEKFGNNARKRIAEGKILLTPEMKEKARQAIRDGKSRPRVAIRNVYSNNNLKEINKDCDGSWVAKRKQATKFGSEEYYEKMRNRPHLKTEEHIDLLRKVCRYKKPRKNKTEGTK